MQKITVVFAQKMDWQTALYRAGSYLRHCLTARHTGGHGIHSPYLFEWVRLVMRDEHSYYAWEKIEKVREKMLADTREVEFVDYGAGIGSRESENENRESGIGSPKTKIGKREARDRRKVSDIAKRSLAKKKYAQMLARLVNWLGDGRLAMGDEQLIVVELGTSLGVTTAYMAAMDKRNQVITYEGCPAVAEIAKENWKALGIKNIDCRVGEITADVLDRDLERVDVAYIDANHTYAGTRAYFNVLAEKVHAKSVVVVDDIHYNKAMEKAWHEICEDERVTSTMDLYQMGLVFFDKDYWKRDYRIKV
ncbi:MAG: class I SAM-dependent methyltransferase [Paludibacteraceae bacterium]|nr:class I SAM-dependent methyltransferase [Paludibacteraceae bacterium]